jgi:predicted phage baseplate assembly protein
LYRAPDNWTDSIQIPPGKRGVIGFGIEGKFETPMVTISAGGPDQIIDIINENNILDEPIFIDVRSGSMMKRWARIEIIERAGPNDEVFEISPIDGGVRVRFGNDKAGKAPLSGEEVTATYRTGGGSRGRIGSNRINESRPLQPEPPASATVEVAFRNLNPSTGGLDSESLDDAKRRAPRQAATLDAAVSGPEYAELASDYSHPVFGSVQKAVATVRTSLNANIVELYVLAVGEDEPVKPSVGLKNGLKTELEETNVITDEVRVLDGELKRVDVDANVVVNRNADAAIVKDEVESAVEAFFDPRNFDLGQEFYLSDLYSAIKAIDGVKFVTIFTPTDDILATNKVASPDEDGVGLNELIILGQTTLRFYFE